MVFMPSKTWPTLSNMPIALHITHIDIVTARIARPPATATSPTVIAPTRHSSIASAVSPVIRALFINETLRSSQVIARVWLR